MSDLALDIGPVRGDADAQMILVDLLGKHDPEQWAHERCIERHVCIEEESGSGQEVDGVDGTHVKRSQEHDPAREDGDEGRVNMDDWLVDGDWYALRHKVR